MIPTLQLGQFGRDVLEDSGDPFFASVVLLVDASSYANGTTPSTLDVRGKTPTYRGNAQVKTDQFLQGSSSLYFDGTNDRVSFADSTDFTYGSGDYTIEAFVRPEGSNAGAQRVLICHANSFGGFYSARIVRNTTDEIEGGQSDGVANVAATTTAPVAMPSDAWTHVFTSRSGSLMWAGGGAVGGAGTAVNVSCVPGSLMNPTGALTIGAYVDADGSIHWKGWIAKLRITKGVARYSATSYTAPSDFPAA